MSTPYIWVYLVMARDGEHVWQMRAFTTRELAQEYIAWHNKYDKDLIVWIEACQLHSQAWGTL